MLRHHHRFIAAIALALALAAAAPAAARPIRVPRPSSVPSGTAASTDACSKVCLANGYATRALWIGPSAELGATLPHNPRGRSEDPADKVAFSPRSDVVSSGGYASPTPHASVVRVAAPSRGFDWGAAGIGAAAAVALMVLTLLAALRTTSIRRHASRTAA